MSLEQVNRIRAMLESRRGETLTVEERRARFEAQAASIPLPDDVCTHDVMIRADLKALWVESITGRKDRMLLWLHGGAFLLGSSRSYRDFGVRLARASGCRVLLLDYRLVPEHPYPAALTDTLDALSWAERQGYDASHIAVGGDSAGGNLAVAAIQARLAAKQPVPAALWLISPYLDLTHSGESVTTRAARDPFVDVKTMPDTAALYLGQAAADDPAASPLFGSVEKFPPTLVQVGSEEVLFDDARRFARKLEAAQVPVTFQEWVGMIHVWPVFAAVIEEGGWAQAQGGAFVASHLL
jgi:acetyl esterase/lipase